MDDIDSQKFRENTLVSIILVVATFISLLGFINYLKGVSHFIIISQFTTVIILLLILLASKLKNQPIILAYGVSVCAMIHLPIKLYLQGTILSSTPVWFVVIPCLSVYFVSTRYGLLFALLSAIEVTTVFMIMGLKKNLWQLEGLIFSALELEALFAILTSLIILVVFMVRTENEKKKWKNRTEKHLLSEGHSSSLAALGEMAAGVAHEINNPLAIILGHSKAIEKHINLTTDVKELDIEKVAYRLDKISMTVHRVSELVSSLLHLSRKETSTERKDVNLRMIFKLFYPLVNERLKSTNVNFIFDSKELDENILCIPERVAQAILNLINNSVHAIEHNGEKWIKFVVVRKDELLLIKIIDSGTDINGSIEDNMFDPFYTTKEVGKGTGLGLSLSRSSIMETGGNLYYDKDSLNTTFIIELPISSSNIDK